MDSDLDSDLTVIDSDMANAELVVSVGLMLGDQHQTASINGVKSLPQQLIGGSKEIMLSASRTLLLRHY